MTLILILFGFYWCFVKSMEWKLRFYGAAALFIAIQTLLNYMYTSAFMGHRQPLDVGSIGIHLGIALLVFYLLERYQDADAPFLWAAIFIGGFAALYLVR
ncbi:MAG: hypothetical protein WDN27_07115 [Candidatus Saccharibacteria bacterium]